MYEVHHENHSMESNGMHEELFGDMAKSFKVMKNFAGAESEVYYVSKTTVPGGGGEGA